MFADPAVVTINAVAYNLVRINQDNYSSEYFLRSATQEYRVKIRNNTYLDKARGVSMDRHNVEIVETVFPVAPATLSTVRRFYVVLENQEGDSLVIPRNNALGLMAFLSSANIDKLLNRES